MSINLVHSLVLAAALALSAAPAPSSDNLTPQNPTDDHCARLCSPEIFYTPDDYATWIVSVVSWTPGEALEFCEPCRPCKEFVLISYFGHSPHWQVTNGTGGAGGSGHGYAFMRLETDCDSPNLGCVHGTAGPGEDLTVQLYCYCLN